MKRSIFTIIFCFNVSTFFNKILNSWKITTNTCSMKWSVSNENYSIIIESRELFILMRTLWHYIWEIAEEP